MITGCSAYTHHNEWMNDMNDMIWYLWSHQYLIISGANQNFASNEWDPATFNGGQVVMMMMDDNDDDDNSDDCASWYSSTACNHIIWWDGNRCSWQSASGQLSSSSMCSPPSTILCQVDAILMIDMRMRMRITMMRISCLYVWFALIKNDPWYHYLSSSRHESSSSSSSLPPLSSWSSSSISSSSPSWSSRRRSSRHPTHLHVSAGSPSVPHPHRW